MPPKRKDPQPGQVGRRPSPPNFLLLVGVLWIACGVYALVKLHAGWKLIPGILFIGIGLFWVRAWATATLRRENRRDG